MSWSNQLWREGLNEEQWVNSIIKFETMYAVVGNTDEGHGRKSVVGYAQSKEFADELAEGHGPMGTNANIEGRNVLRIKYHDGGGVEHCLCVNVGSVKAMDVSGEQKLQKLIENAGMIKVALAKLTEKERELLGV